MLMLEGRKEVSLKNEIISKIEIGESFFFRFDLTFGNKRRNK